MFDTPYEFRAVSTPKEPMPNTVWVFTFQADVKDPRGGKLKGKTEKYIVRAEIQDHRLFMLKFYPKRLRLSDSRYHVITGRLHCSSKVLMTMLAIASFIRKKVPDSSFGFIGMPLWNPITEEREDTFERTKRYQKYMLALAADMFKEADYVHVNIEERSAFFSLNKSYAKHDQALLDLGQRVGELPERWD